MNPLTKIAGILCSGPAAPFVAAGVLFWGIIDACWGDDIFDFKKIEKMNYIQRLWYSVYELVTTRSIYSDTPFAGAALVCVVLITMVFLSVVIFWKCLSIVYGFLSPYLDYSRIQVAVGMGVPFVVIYFFSKKRGRILIESFKNESDILRKKRKQEFKIVAAIDVTLLLSACIWRICLG